MTMMKRTVLGVVAAAVAFVALAAPATAQDRPSYELPAIEVAVLQNDLHQTAISLYEIPTFWKLAGDLHKQAAENLPRNDAGQFFGFNRAAVLYFHAGEFDDARRAMEDAAEVAHATGDEYVAASTYVDAAFIAIAEGFAGKKREFVRQARLLLDSESLTAEERAEILSRIEGEPAGPRSAQVALAARLGSPMTLAAD
jgi:ATP/maltotriose-dependent transcriptional regulator MalT